MFGKLNSWWLQATGRSYWHVPIPMAVDFRPQQLGAYFMDFSRKTDWPGAIDDHGIPLLPSAQGLVYFPTTIFQKGLGHWNQLAGKACDDATAMAHSEDLHAAHFIACAEWALRHIDERGGWRLPGAPCPYSAMTQGEGVSLLVRAGRLTGRSEFLQAAARAHAMFDAEPSERGIIGRHRNLPTLEEYPGSENRTILNGYVFALMGLLDFALATGDERHQALFDLYLNSLRQLLPDFDAGYWSLYDQSGNIASPFYHRLHIAQLSALARLDPTGPWNGLAAKFDHQLARYSCSLRAIGKKIAQRLFTPEPSHGVQKV